MEKTLDVKAIDIEILIMVTHIVEFLSYIQEAFGKTIRPERYDPIRGFIKAALWAMSETLPLLDEAYKTKNYLDDYTESAFPIGMSMDKMLLAIRMDIRRVLVLVKSSSFKHNYEVTYQLCSALDQIGLAVVRENEMEYKDKHGVIRIAGETIGRVAHLELSMNQDMPERYDPFIDLHIDQEQRDRELAESFKTRVWTGEAQLIFDKTNVHQAQLVHVYTEITFELNSEIDDIVTGKALIEQVDYTEELERTIKFKVKGEINIKARI